MVSFCLLLTGCSDLKKEELTMQDIEVFKGTPVWELAKAVENENIVKLKKLITERPEIVNYQESIYGTTLLMRSIGAEKFNSAKVLLENGADPNIISTIGTTALFEAVSYSWEDVNANTDAKFVKLLLDNDANPNATYCGRNIIGQTDPIECGASPLMHAVSRSFEKAKLLVESGANIDYKTKSGKTASSTALLMNAVDAAYFLIVKLKAKVNEPYYFYGHGIKDTVINFEKPHYPVDLLYDWVYELGSEEHRKKMEIVEVFKEQGIDYFDSNRKISNLIIRRIKKIHPDDWEEYLVKY